MSSQLPIKLIVGLGNPGAQYKDTRHNAGVWFVEQVARGHSLHLQPESRFFGDMARAKHHGNPLFLLSPTTYMNRSGQSVAALTHYFKIQPEEMLVVHDELDLLPGQLKLKKGGGHAGHNGLRDIQKHLGTNAYWRARIGIGHPRTLNLNQSVSDFVLHRPAAEEENKISKSIDVLFKHLPLLLDGHFNQACTKVHTEVEADLK